MRFSTLVFAALVLGSGLSAQTHDAQADGHDMVTMPGLRSPDATEQESFEIEVMFRNFPLIVRSVENLPNGIRTVTGSEDPDVMAAIVSHVIGMSARVDEGRDPKIPIQSPTLDLIFERRDAIETTIEVTDEGIVVLQTSDDPLVVETLQTHAAEVSDLAARGMVPIHERLGHISH